MLIDRIQDKIDSLSEDETYSTILFLLFKLKGIPDYLMLSELIFLIDNKSFLNLLKFWGGKTITLPTMYEFKTLTKALCVFKDINLKGEQKSEVLKNIEFSSELEKKDVIETYNKIVGELGKFEFRKSVE